MCKSVRPGDREESRDIHHDLCCSGDYDALLVLMLLPRMAFKADLVINQLKQQHKLDDALGSLSTLNPSSADQLVFICTLIHKLTNLNMLVNQSNRLGQRG